MKEDGLTEKNGKVVLVIAPHLDDEVLGCGGVISKHVASGDTVFVCFVAHRVYNHVYEAKKVEVEKDHALKAKTVMGYRDFRFLNLSDERLDLCIQDIIIPVEDYVMDVKPNIVYSPFRNDNHQDHQAVAKAVQIVLRPLAGPFIQRWLMFETPSSTEQASGVGILGFQPNVYNDISDYLNLKLKALACYETEARPYPHPRSPEGIKALAMKRGMESGISSAEAFMLAREVT